MRKPCNKNRACLYAIIGPTTLFVTQHIEWLVYVGLLCHVGCFRATVVLCWRSNAHKNIMFPHIYIYILALGNIANLTHGLPMSVQTSELRGTLGIVRCLYILPVGVGYDLCGRSVPWISEGALRRRISMNFMRYDAHVRCFEQRSRIQNATRSASSGTCYLYR